MIITFMRIFSIYWNMKQKYFSRITNPLSKKIYTSQIALLTP